MKRFQLVVTICILSLSTGLSGSALAAAAGTGDVSLEFMGNMPGMQTKSGRDFAIALKSILDASTELTQTKPVVTSSGAIVQELTLSCQAVLGSPLVNDSNNDILVQGTLTCIDFEGTPTQQSQDDLQAKMKGLIETNLSQATGVKLTATPKAGAVTGSN